MPQFARKTRQPRDRGKVRRVLGDRALDPIRRRGREVADERRRARFVESPVAVDHQRRRRAERVAHGEHAIEPVANPRIDGRRRGILGDDAVERRELDGTITGGDARAAPRRRSPAGVRSVTLRLMLA